MFVVCQEVTIFTFFESKGRAKHFAPQNVSRKLFLHLAKKSKSVFAIIQKYSKDLQTLICDIEIYLVLRIKQLRNSRITESIFKVCQKYNVVQFSAIVIFVIFCIANTVFAQGIQKNIQPENQTQSSPVVFDNKDQAVKLLSSIAKNTPNTIQEEKVELVTQNLINNGDIVNAEEEQTEPAQLNRNTIIEYTIEENDTIDLITQKFGLTKDTIKQANNLADDVVQSGQNLTILPADGILHIVEKGDTISEIVEKHQGDLQKTFEKNSLTSDLIFAGQKIAVIDGKIQPEKQINNNAKKKVQATNSARTTNRTTNVVYSRNVVKLYQDYTNNCYAWVVKQGYHPVGRGNARNIVTNSSMPQVGGLVVTYESSAGHVAIVVAVGDGTFTLQESNYIKGWITQRTLPINYGKLKGFVN